MRCFYECVGGGLRSKRQGREKIGVRVLRRLSTRPYQLAGMVCGKTPSVPNVILLGNTRNRRLANTTTGFPQANLDEATQMCHDPEAFPVDIKIRGMRKVIMSNKKNAPQMYCSRNITITPRSYDYRAIETITRFRETTWPKKLSFPPATEPLRPPGLGSHLPRLVLTILRTGECLPLKTGMSRCCLP